MFDRPPVIALRDTLATVVAEHPMLLDANRQVVLQQQVCAVVEDFKAAGWQPERVIIAVKQIAADAGLKASPRVLSAATPLTERDAVIGDLVRWCIEHYYHGNPPPS